MVENENKDLAAEKAIEAAYELQISQETRDFLKGIQDDDEKRPSIRPLALTGIAAALLVLVISIATINLSHDANSIADKYGINAIVARSGSNINNDQFREAVQKYYAGKYGEAQNILVQIGDVEGRLLYYKDWLSLLIELKTEGSKSKRFEEILASVVEDDSHEFNAQAKKMKSDLDLFWRAFVLKK